MENQIFTLVFITAIGLVVAYLTSLQAMFNVASKSDPSLFEELGSPHIIKNNKPSHTFKILRVLLTLRYLHSNSTSVKLWGNISLMFFTLTLLSYGLLAYVY